MANNRRQERKGNAINSMTISAEVLNYAWRPNNFRRQIKIIPLSNSGVKKLLTTIPDAKQNKHTKIISIKDYCDNITVQIFKEKILLIWKQERYKNIKKWYAINGSSINEIQGKVEHHKTEITTLLDSAAEMLRSQCNIEYFGLPVWVRYEDALKGDSYLDSLPREVIIHAEHFKKVYADEVEFIGRTSDEPTVKMTRYINNRVVEKFTPEICKEINKLASDLRLLNGDVIRWCGDNIKCFDDLLKYEEVIKYLPENKRAVITDYLFMTFGGCIK